MKQTGIDHFYRTEIQTVSLLFGNLTTVFSHFSPKAKKAPCSFENTCLLLDAMIEKQNRDQCTFCHSVSL